MEIVNPYQPPMTDSGSVPASLADGYFSARECPCCRSRFTFWTALRQITPFRLKCPRCKLVCRIITPGMASIAIAVTIGSALCTVGVCLATAKFGLMGLLPTASLWGGIYVLIEWWTHQYITQKGRLVPIRFGMPQRVLDQPPESASLEGAEPSAEFHLSRV
jgi:hypothetical protein